MKIQDILKEETLTSAEGQIEEESLDKMISAVMTKYNISDDKFDEIKDAVVYDYKDSDISKVTARDIVKIMDRGGIL